MSDGLSDAIRDLVIWADQQPDLAPELRRKIERLREAKADHDEWNARYGDD